MSINVTITANNPIELSQILQGLAAVLPGAVPAPLQAAGTSESTASRRQTGKATETNSAKPPEEPAPNAEAQVQTAAGDAPPWEPTKEAAPAVTLEEIRAKLAGLVRAGKQAEVKALFPKFGASKLSEVPKDQLGDLMAAAKEIA